MNQKTEKYIAGMQAVNNFFEMLHQALHDALPGAWLAKSGAYVWRGYRISKYRELAGGQYYCQIYPGNPNLLHFKESYACPEYKPIDERDITFGVKDWVYYYPFRLTLNLYQTRFFFLNAEEQFKLLHGFTSFAGEQCRMWQQSTARARVTSQEFLHGDTGKKPGEIPFKPFSQVTIDYLDAFVLQEILFAKLKHILEQNVPQILNKEIEPIVPNANYHNFGFRGLRMKFTNSAHDHSDYLWEIYYNKPTSLRCFRYDGKNRDENNRFDIQGSRFFDLKDEEQTQALMDFVVKALKAGI